MKFDYWALMANVNNVYDQFGNELRRDSVNEAMSACADYMGQIEAIIEKRKGEKK